MRNDFQKGEHSFRLPACFSSLVLGGSGDGEIVSSNRVELTWETTARRCALYVSPTPDFRGCEPRSVAPSTIPTGTQPHYAQSVTNLAEDTTYYWKVRPVAQGDLSAESVVRTFRVRLP
jgi:hypothetical protein